MVTDPAAHWDVPRPVAACRDLLAVIEDRGINPQRCLAGTGITVGDLADNGTEVQAAQELTLIRNALSLVDDPADVAREVGLRHNLATIGMLGYALLSSPTINDAVTVACRFATLTSTFLMLRRHNADDGIIVEFDDTAAPADVRQFVTQRDFFAIARMAPLLIGGLDSLYDDDAVPVTLEIGDHAMAEEVAELFTGTSISVEVSHRFALRLPTDLLRRRMPASDEITATSCVAQCEELLESRRRRRGVSAQVRARLIRDPGNVPSMSSVAAEMNCTERTLHRRLAEENTTFRMLVDEVRETLALTLLGTGLTVEETARHLGYAETAAFTRAFSRWRGAPPSAYRRRP